ncbi:hypothetical protein HAD_06065 [Hyphomonas adhaerens MHS-3]|uniref:Uncharacterized protein n=1 Tax=Hyphomonas adhaerens MHS-3 TaxID=1280949 RepID=A0A069E5K6_9PROT|nr:hypothetical protein HAD_06065 [Hyphomonas adhaerens MHS-3]
MPGGTAVIIPTTVGLVRVQQLRVDKNLHHAVMTVNFRTERANVTSAYAQFVAADTGVISKLTRDYRYRVKVSRNIVSGPSWKLGMLFAHLLQNSEKLSETDGPMPDSAAPSDLVGRAKRIIWATGDVSDELGILPVSHVMRKLEQSLDLFKWCEAHGIPVDCYLPEELSSEPSEHEEIMEYLNRMEARFSGLSVHRLDKFPEDIETLQSAGAGERRIRLPRSILVGICLFGVLAVAGAASLRWKMNPDESVQGVPTSPEASQAEGGVHLKVVYEENGKCFQNRTLWKTLEVDLGFGGEDALTLPADACLCGLDWSISGADGLSQSVKVASESQGAPSDMETIKNYNGGSRAYREAYSSRISRVSFEVTGNAMQPARVATLQIEYRAAP